MWIFNLCSSYPLVCIIPYLKRIGQVVFKKLKTSIVNARRQSRAETMLVNFKIIFFYFLLNSVFIKWNIRNLLILIPRAPWSYRPLWWFDDTGAILCEQIYSLHVYLDFPLTNATPSIIQVNLIKDNWWTLYTPVC